MCAKGAGRDEVGPEPGAAGEVQPQTGAAGSEPAPRENLR